jgi:large subunit ribosomal protein L19
MEERRSLGIRPGDTVRVHQKIVDDKGKARIQIFEGLVLARKHGNEPGATFTVRKVASGVGVEKIYPLYSPMIDKLEIVKRAKVRRAKLYHIREKVNREIKRQMRRMSLVSVATESGAEAAAREAEEAKRAEEAAAKEAEEAAAKEAAAAETAPEVAETPAEDSTPAEDEQAKVMEEKLEENVVEEDTPEAAAVETTTEAPAEDSTPAEDTQAEVMEEKLEETKEAAAETDEEKK